MSKKIQVGTELDTTGVRAGFDQIVSGAKGMARGVKESTEGARTGMEGLSGTSDEAAKRVDRSTKSIIASIERTTAAHRAGEKGTAAFYETLARQRGANVEALQPYLAQLRQVEQQQQRVGVSAGQTAAAMRMLPAQFTDIFTSLASGQAPLTVMIQQGGQIKDSFGGAGNALRAMSQYVLGLINPLSLLGMTAAAVALAWYQGGAEARRFESTLITTGNAVGVTTAELTQLSRSLRDATGGTMGRAAEVLNQLAASGLQGATALEMAANASIRLERVGGPAAERTAEAFASLAKDPLQAALKLNEAQNFLTQSTYEQIKAAQDQGRTSDATRIAVEAYYRALDERIPQLEANLGWLEKAWRFVGSSAKSTWDAMLGIGREDPADKLKKLRERLAVREAAGMTGGDAGRATEALREQIRLEAEKQEAAKKAADGKSEEAERLKRLIDYRKDNERYLTNEERLHKELNKAYNDGVAAGEEMVAINARLAAIRQQYDPQTYLDRIAQAETQRNEAIKRGVLEVNGLRERGALNEYQAIEQQAQLEQRALNSRRQALVEQLGYARQRMNSEREVSQLTTQIAGIDQESITAKTAARERLATAIERQRQQTIKLLEAEREQTQQDIDAELRREQDARVKLEIAQMNNAEALRNEADLIKLEISLLGASREERERALAQFRVQLDLKRKLREIDEANLPGGEAERDEKRAEARRQAAQEMANKEKRIQLESWQEVTTEMNRSLTDALLRGFESGKSAAQVLRETVVNMFKSMVLRPVIQAIVTPVIGGIASMMGLGSMGGMAGGVINGIAGSMGTGVMSTVLGGLGLGAISMSSLGSAFGAGFMSTLGGGTVLGGGSAAGLLAGGAGTGTSLAGILGAAAPWVGAAALIANAVGLMRTTKTVGSGITGTLGSGDIQDFVVKRKSGTLFSGPDYSTPTIGVSSLSKELQATFDKLREQAALQAEALGLDAAAARRFTTQIGSEKLSDDTGGRGIRLEGLSQEQAMAKIKEAMDQASNELFKAVLGPMERLKKEGESAAQTVERLASIQVFTKRLGDLGGVFAQVAGATVDAKASLIDLVGGLDSLASQTQSYISNYYSRDEIAGGKAAEVRRVLGGLGINQDFSGEDAKAKFRTLVDTTDISTEAGRKRLATLLGIQGDFADVADYLAESGKSLSAAAAGAPQANSLGPLMASGAAQQVAATNGVQVAVERLHDTMKRFAERVGPTQSEAGWSPNRWREVTLESER